MSINLVRYEGHTVLPKNDVDLQKRFFTKSGFLSGCVLSQVSTNVIKITAGKGIIQGGDFEVLEENIQVVLPSSGGLYGWIYIKVDLSDLETPISFKSVLEVGAVEPDWIQNANFYETNGVYELPILQYYASSTNITEIIQKAIYMTGVYSSVETNEAPLYTDSAYYSVGDIVRYSKDGFMYRCKSATTLKQNPIDHPGNWTQVNIGNEIILAKKPATVGIGTVVATSLTPGQVFTAPSDGVYQFKSTFTATSGYLVLQHSNGQTFQINPPITVGYANYQPIPINAGQTITVTTLGSLGVPEVKFFPQYA